MLPHLTFPLKFSERVWTTLAATVLLCPGDFSCSSLLLSFTEVYLYNLPLVNTEELTPSRRVNRIPSSICHYVYFHVFRSFTQMKILSRIKAATWRANQRSCLFDVSGADAVVYPRRRWEKSHSYVGGDKRQSDLGLFLHIALSVNKKHKNKLHFWWCCLHPLSSRAAASVGYLNDRWKMFYYVIFIVQCLIQKQRCWEFRNGAFDVLNSLNRW